MQLSKLPRKRATKSALFKFVMHVIQLLYQYSLATGSVLWDIHLLCYRYKVNRIESKFIVVLQPKGCVIITAFSTQNEKSFNAIVCVSHELN